MNIQEKQEIYLKYLHICYEIRREKNRSYSRRAFARDLDIDNGNLKKILDKKISISAKTALKIGKMLNLQDQELLAFILPSLE